MPISDKQLTANRLNAKKSTGPRTPGGKHNSSRNATTHGLLARSVLLPGESLDRFLALNASYIEEYQPTSRTECDLVEIMAVCTWRMRRAWTFESVSIAHEQRTQSASTTREDPPTQGMLAHRALTHPPKSQESLTGYEVRLDREYHRAASLLVRLQTAKRMENEKRSRHANENKETHAFPQPIRTIPETHSNHRQNPIEPAA